MKARRLRKMRFHRVDLVPKGANQLADVTLYKSADAPKEMDMSECKKCGAAMKADEKECAKCGAEAVAKAAQAAKEQEVMNEQIKKLEGDLKAASDLAEEESKKREAVEKALRDQGDTIAKLQKQLDASEAAIKKAQDEAKLAEFKKTVDAFEHLPVKPDVFAPVLKACSEALDEAGYAELMRVLKAADAASGENFTELGAPGHGTTSRSAMDELQAKAAELVTKSAGKLDENAALFEASRQNPKLAERARKESYAARIES